MRFAIFLCLPIIVYVILEVASDSLKLEHNPQIYMSPHVAPLAGFIMTLLVAFFMATRETPSIFFGLLMQAYVFINLLAFPLGMLSEFSSLLMSLILLISDIKQQCRN